MGFLKNRSGSHIPRDKVSGWPRLGIFTPRAQATYSLIKHLFIEHLLPAGTILVAGDTVVSKVLQTPPVMVPPLVPGRQPMTADKVPGGGKAYDKEQSRIRNEGT